MADKIKLRAGSKAKIPILSEREIGYCTDENALYIGTPEGNKKVGGSVSIEDIIAALPVYNGEVE